MVPDRSKNRDKVYGKQRQSNFLEEMLKSTGPVNSDLERSSMLKKNVQVAPKLRDSSRQSSSNLNSSNDGSSDS